jgi:hypothetical protein
MRFIARIFCFSCVAWQCYVCLKKYIEEPITSNVAYVSDDGSYPGAITFCKNLYFSQMHLEPMLANETLEDLLYIEVESVGREGWSIIYDGGSLISEYELPSRNFTTFSWSDDIFKFCLSFQLGTETQKLARIRFKYKWLDCRRDIVYSPPNLQAFVHGWGSFGKDNHEVPITQTNQIFQLKQETIVTLSTKDHKCSSYDNSFLDECLERRAVEHANMTVGCITELQR